MTQHDDLLYLGQMLDAAQEARVYVDETTREAFSTDRMRQRAVVNVIQNIGEAARQVSAQGRALLPDLPWPKIIGMRHKLVHNYVDIDYEEVWRTATDDLPPLIDALQRVVPDRPPT